MNTQKASFSKMYIFFKTLFENVDLYNHILKFKAVDAVEQDRC